MVPDNDQQICQAVSDIVHVVILELIVILDLNFLVYLEA